MEDEIEIVRNLIAGGIIGATLGALIADDNQEGAIIGAMAGAVIFATLKANNEARQTKVPFYIQENGALYEIAADGTKHFVKKVEKSPIHLNKRFILE